METAQEEESKDFPQDSDLPSHKDYFIKTLLSWSAPGRPFKKRSKQFYMTALLIAFLIEIILFLFSQYMLMFVVISLVFVSFAFAYVPPRDFHYKISTEGVRIEDHYYIWHELYDFFFTKRSGVEVLNIRTKSMFPGVLTLSLGEMPSEHVKQVMAHYLPFREYVKPTFLDRSGNWLAKNFPLENAS